MAEDAEADQVVAWRCEQLTAAGYEPWDAIALAWGDADLHEAIRLVEAGCRPDLAAEILR